MLAYESNPSKMIPKIVLTDTKVGWMSYTKETQALDPATNHPPFTVSCHAMLY